MDIIKLLAGEQRSLLHAKFGAPANRSRHVADAIDFAETLVGTRYPHRNVVQIATAAAGPSKRSRYSMSRAMNLSATCADVEAAALKQKARITSIESLHPGGTRVVFASADAAAQFARAFKSRILSGKIVRTPLRTRGTS